MTSGDELSRLFQAERAVRPPPAALERGLSRLLGDVAQRVAPLPVASGALKLGGAMLPKWILLGFALGLGAAGVAAIVSTPTRVAGAPVERAPEAAVAQAPIMSAQPDPTPLPAAAASAAPIVALAADSRHAPSAISGASATTPASASAQPSASASTFDAELQLITAAKRELDRGQPHLAAAWLAEHAARFPAGVFALDRDALRVLARCSERPDPSIFREFSAQHPSSPMLDRLQSACERSARPEPAARPDPSAVDFPNLAK